MKRLTLAVISISLVLLSGCASSPPPAPQFTELAIQSLPPPPTDKAQVVFLEPINSIQGIVPVGLFEVNGDTRTHLATTGSHTKVALNFTPGRHLLMAAQIGIKAHFMEINVEAGKRYYVLERFIYGNGFQLRPIRVNGSSDYSVNSTDFPSWNSVTRFVAMTPASVEIFEKHKESVSKTQAEGWRVWNEKSPQQRAELTLNPEDAVAH
ncbi:hypothetical protein RBA41_16630 [Massilia sp. CCM 9210]|uniref:hypothetical protein n=1 Tax=Massilia scottii TaxID=3057166 RepID=UPI002796986C|nr:hypothetical protein [Massilia sp. CCM 9210]MDQ1814935.1 hypothetical protein [Massilia sp. CCM 9210]